MADNTVTYDFTIEDPALIHYALETFWFKYGMVWKNMCESRYSEDTKIMSRPSQQSAYYPKELYWGVVDRYGMGDEHLLNTTKYRILKNWLDGALRACWTGALEARRLGLE